MLLIRSLSPTPSTFSFSNAEVAKAPETEPIGLGVGPRRPRDGVVLALPAYRLRDDSSLPRRGSDRRGWGPSMVALKWVYGPYINAYIYIYTYI